MQAPKNAIGREQLTVNAGTPLPEINTTVTTETIDPAIKPGVETSEFWVTLISAIVPNLVTILAIFKIVPNEVASTLSSAAVALIGGIITLFVTLKYIKSRTEVKTKALEIEDFIRTRNINQKNIDKQFMFNLFEKGVISSEQIKKEFKMEYCE
jgi:hypothetical protein